MGREADSVAQRRASDSSSQKQDFSNMGQENIQHTPHFTASDSFTSCLCCALYPSRQNIYSNT
jgi:hypothetical protein